MKIYLINGDFNNYNGCVVNYDSCKGRFVDEPHASPMNSATTEPYGDSWWPREVNKLDDQRPIGDYVPGIADNVLVMNKKAIDVLKDIMGDFEILPIVCDFGEYWGVNILNFCDCTDYEKSEYKTFNGDPRLPNGHPRIMRYIKHAFIPENIIGKHAFRDLDHPWCWVFVDELFVETVQKNNITGFKFELLWES